MYYGGYPSYVYLRVYYGGYPSLVYARVVHGGYTPSWYMPGYTPLGTPPVHHCCPVYRSSCPSSTPLPAEGALGSKKEKPLGEASLRVLKSLIL